MASTNRFDAIVIGSGVSGGFAAKELTEKGLRVLMLDRGMMVEHRRGLYLRRQARLRSAGAQHDAASR